MTGLGSKAQCLRRHVCSAFGSLQGEVTEGPPQRETLNPATLEA